MMLWVDRGALEGTNRRMGVQPCPECARMGERTNEHARISVGTNRLACHWQRTKTTMLHACVHVAGAGRVVKLCVEWSHA